MRRVLAMAALALLAVSSAEAQVEARPISLLVYHVEGGREPDPLASPAAPPPLDAERLPATLFDRVARADAAPENAPESALAHFREFQRALAARETEPAGTTITLRGELRPGSLRVDADVGRGGVDVGLVVFEHGAVAGGRPQPYVARFVAQDQRVPEGSTRVSTSLALDPAWSVERLGVVAIARAEGRVLQSATWTPRADAPTVQTARAVLVEHVTAAWCDPCRPADEGIALLATQRGFAGPLEPGDVSYWRAPSSLFYVGLVGGALAALGLVGRRDA